MTETASLTAGTTTAGSDDAVQTTSTAKSNGLAGLKLAQLQALAGQLGITGGSRMRKGDLVAAISAHQRGSSVADRPARAASAPAETAEPAKRSTRSSAKATAVSAEPAAEAAPAETATERPARGRGRSRRAVSDGVIGTDAAVQLADTKVEAAEPAKAEPAQSEGESNQNDGDARRQPRTRNRRAQGGRNADAQDNEEAAAATAAASAPAEATQSDNGQGDNGDGADRGDRNQRNNRNDRNQQRNNRAEAPARNDAGNRNEDEDGSRNNRNRRNRRDRTNGTEQVEQRNDRNDRGGRNDRNDRNDRFRDRNERRRGRNAGPDFDDVEVTEDDVLLPVAGILDVLDNYAFVRTSGYLPGSNDVYVSLSQVKKYNLRKGDAVVGAIRAPREGEDRSQAQSARQKFNALVRVTSVNGKNPDELKDRVEFSKLVPLYPSERLRLETDPKKVGPRVIDLVAPIGKGQRGLIVSPPKAGKTLILQSIANAITINNPEVHLMMVLVDERPEEVTDMQRTVKG